MAQGRWSKLPGPLQRGESERTTQNPVEPGRGPGPPACLETALCTVRQKSEWGWESPNHFHFSAKEHPLKIKITAPLAKKVSKFSSVQRVTSGVLEPMSLAS